MVRKIIALAALCAAFFPATGARAGLYGDELTKCLVRSAKSNDQILLVQWMFSSMSLHPAVRPLVSITPAQRDSFTRRTGDLFVRLMTADCRSEAIDALKYEGNGALAPSFMVLGQIAARGLMTEAHVAEGMKAMGVYFSHSAKLTEVLKAAGVAPQQAPAGAPGK